MPFVQRVIEPKYLSRTSLWDENGKPLIKDDELEAVTNNTLSNALRQLASVVLVADDIFMELGGQLQGIKKRADALKVKIQLVEDKASAYDPKKVTVPESDICTFALLKNHYETKYKPDTNLFTAATRPPALKEIYEAATKTPVVLMRQMDRWRRDGHRSSRFFMCTPILGGSRRRKIRNKVDIDIETSMPAIVKELRKWTSDEAVGDITVTPDCPNRISSNVATSSEDAADGIATYTDDKAIDHTLPSPEEQLQMVALKFPAEIIAVDVSGRSFHRQSMQRRSLLPGDLSSKTDEESGKKRTRSRKPRSRRRNTLAGTDQKEIRDALTGGEEPCSSSNNIETEPIGAVRSKSSDLLRSSKKDSPPSDKKSHFNTLKQWGKNRYDRFMNKCTSDTRTTDTTPDDIDDFNIYETVTMKRKRSVEKERRHERNPSISSSDKSSVNLPMSPLSSVINIAVKLRDSSAQRRQRRTGGDEPHSSSGNWSASSESGRASIGSEFTTTTQPKSTTSAATSSNSLNQPIPPSSVNSRRRFNMNASTSTSEGTLTPDIIHDLHEDGETSSIYSCDTEGYYTSFHMDSGLKTLKEEELPCTPLHSTSAFCHSDSNSTVLTAENEYELFGKGSTSTTTSSAGTVCTTLRASGSSRSLNHCPAVPERKSSLSKNSQNKAAEDCDKTGTVKRSPATAKGTIALVHHASNGDVSPDSGHNTSSSPIESINSPNGVRSGSEFEFSESSDMEGHERTERIRIKTTINSSRIPSMCVITPPHSDDESIKSYNSMNNFHNNSADQKGKDRKLLELNLKPGGDTKTLKSSDSDKENYNIQTRTVTTTIGGTNRIQLVNVNQQSGYATVENLDKNDNLQKNTVSPSGGTVTVAKDPASKSPIIKASLMPLNTMLGKIRTNIANFAHRSSKSPNRNNESTSDSGGDYVTLADVRNNNEKPLPELIYANEWVNTPTIEQVRPTEYVSLNDLPCAKAAADSLERKRRQGARVTLDAEGKVVYSSDSLKRRKGAHTTFEPGPCVKAESPVGAPRAADGCPLSPRLSKLVVRAGSEVVRVPGTTIVASCAPKSGPRGAYVHMQDTGAPLSPTHDKERVPSPTNYPVQPNPSEAESIMYNYRDYGPENHYYIHPSTQTYQTLPNKRTQYLHHTDPVRSVTPDITRGLTHSILRPESDLLRQNMIGIPVDMPDINTFRRLDTVPSPQPDPGRYHHPTPYFTHISPHREADDSLRISPIDPRNAATGFKSSTPSNKGDLKAALNLDHMLSPKKTTMSNEELYAVIHKGKKKMHIEEERTSPVLTAAAKEVKGPESGYLADKSRSRLSWSPTKGDYVDFNKDIDKISNDSRSRQSWACSDRKGTCQTSRLDFKKLLLQKGSSGGKKISAVEQLKISKQQPVQPNQSLINILELSGSPRSLYNRKFASPQGSPVKEKQKAPPVKLMSPRSQWRFANPRTDVLSSTILEDCREDESPNNSIEKRRLAALAAGNGRKNVLEDDAKQIRSISERLQAQRAQFFASAPNSPSKAVKNNQFDCQSKQKGPASPPTLETAF